MRSIGQWRCWNHKGTEYIFAKCPGCGVEFRLDHDINKFGVVTPSMECPGEGCTFHDSVILVGWSGQAVVKSGAD